MGIILYDDDWVSVGLILPSYASIKKDINNDLKWSIDFNTQNDLTTRQIEDYIRVRNNSLTMNTQRNINGKLVGDFTCCAEINGEEIKALITINTDNSSNTRFWDNSTWQADASTISMTIEKVI